MVESAHTDTNSYRPPAPVGHRLFRGLMLVLAVFLVYQPVWKAGFIWDDAEHLTRNPTIVGPLGFKDIWTSHAADIAPLTRSTFWLEHKVWGLTPAPYHLVNIALHALGAIVLWQLLLRLRIPGAWMAAAVWALHPVQVESVAWISEMKNTESGLFLLISILCFVCWQQATEGSRRYLLYACTLLFATMAIASKSSAVVLPLLFLLCAWWMDGGLSWRRSSRRLIALIPVVLFSAVGALVSIWTTGRGMATDPDPQPVRSLPERVIAAGDAVWFYLGKLLWPHPQMAIYPHWSIDAAAVLEYVPGLVLVAAFGVMWWKRKTWARPGLPAIAWFMISLLPVLGLVDHYILRYSLVFDHFQYLASMGPLVLIGLALTQATVRFARRFTPSGRIWLQALLCATVLLTEAGMTWDRAAVFQSEETLWTDTLDKNPDCWVAHYNLGTSLLRRGSASEAIAHYRAALGIHPGYALALNNLGVALFGQGQAEAALNSFREAVERDPGFAEAHNNLGAALLKLRGPADAIPEFESALRLDSGYTSAQDHLAEARALQRQ